MLQKVKKPRLPTLDQVQHTFRRLLDRLRIKLAGPDEQLSEYRQLALQLARGVSGRGSALMATPAPSAPVARSCSLLASNLALILKKPLLLADVSDDGGRLADLLGLTSDMYRATGDRSRYFSVSGRWYVSTREGIPIGPYNSAEEARHGLTEFIAMPAATKGAEAGVSTETFILPTCYQNLFYLPREPARQALVRGVYVGDQEGAIRGLLSGLYERFGYVLFYGGSISENPLILTVAPHVDTVLHTVVENDTKVADLQSAQELLLQCRGDPIPFVLVRASQRSQGAELTL